MSERRRGGLRVEGECMCEGGREGVPIRTLLGLQLVWKFSLRP